MDGSRQAIFIIKIILILVLISTVASRSFGEVEVIFNSTRPLVDEIIYHFKEAAPLSPRDGSGSIDVAIFSFTSKCLADELLRIGRDYPDVKIRVLANLSMLESPFSVIPFLENIMIFSGPEERHWVDDFMAKSATWWMISWPSMMRCGMTPRVPPPEMNAAAGGTSGIKKFSKNERTREVRPVPDTSSDYLI
jgi:hypothetical protein